MGGPFKRNLYPAVFEILRSKRIGVTTRDHLIAHMPFSMGGPLERSLYKSSRFRDIALQAYRSHEFDLSREGAGRGDHLIAHAISYW